MQFLIGWWLLCCRSAPPTDVVPTFKTTNERICLLLSSNQLGMLRIQDAERLQVPNPLPPGDSPADSSRT